MLGGRLKNIRPGSALSAGGWLVGRAGLEHKDENNPRLQGFHRLTGGYTPLCDSKLLVRSSQPGILPRHRNVLIVPAILGVGGVAVGKLETLILVDGN